MRTFVHWAPGSILSVGVILTMGLGPQRSMELRQPLDEVVPATLDGMPGTDVEISQAEARVAGFDDYLFRSHGDNQEGFSLYVGYYESQTKGHTIHSPKNCLPGSGWQALSATTAPIEAADGRTVTVNRYILQNDDQRALVLYWYQGRGRVAHNEYGVKWDLLRDAALHRRSDEALVRIVVPITGSEEASFQQATEVAAEVIPTIDRALPL